MLRNSICHVIITGILFGYGWGYSVTVVYMSGRRRCFDFPDPFPVSSMLSVVPKSVQDFMQDSNMIYRESDCNGSPACSWSFLGL